MIGCLLYLGLRRPPDILAPVLILARFQNAPTAFSYRSVKRVLRYIRGTTDFGITYHSAGSMEMQSFVDSDYAGDTLDHNSMTGYLIKLGEALVIWGSKKQTAVALSTCESEYYALGSAVQEVIWIKRVFKEAGLKVNCENVPVRSDNQAAISWAVSEKNLYRRAKHIDVRIHFIRNLVKEMLVVIVYVPSEDNDSDILTKPLGPAIFQKIRIRLGLGAEIEEER